VAGRPAGEYHRRGGQLARRTRAHARGRRRLACRG
jgi:hypothetical protein